MTLFHMIYSTQEMMGYQKVFLKIYEDNKTVESEKFHLDVDISYKETI